MAMHVLKHFIGLFMLISVAGCSTIYKPMQPNPEMFKIEKDQIPPTTTTESIALINTVESTEKMPLGSIGRVEYTVDYNEWTDHAVSHTKHALELSDAVISEDGTKILKLSMVDAKLEFGAVNSRCTAVLAVETGDGYKNQYTAQKNATAGIVYLPQVACEGAIPRTVRQMLEDQGIQDYLNQ